MPSLAILGGRVIDPATSLDRIANVLIVDGVVADVTTSDVSADVVIDAANRIVCPGFVDVHVHAHDPLAQSLMIRNGVTTALELEMGSADVNAFAERLAGRSLLHFGCSASYNYIRTSRQTGFRQVSIDERLSSEQAEDIEQLARQPVGETDVKAIHRLLALEIAEGAIGVGLGLEYCQGVDQVEVYQLFSHAADLGVTVFVHTREWPSANRGQPLAAMQEVIACAASTGARAHLCHVSSKGLDDTPVILEAIAGARERGVKVSVEVPSVAGATGRIGSALFSPGWTKRWNTDYSALEWPGTGERLTKDTFDRFRREQPMALVMKHITPEHAVERAIQDPNTIVASDAVSVVGGTAGNPRAAATHSRVLGHYVRDRGLLSLNEAIRKMTLAPAQLLEHICSDASAKGRISPGADADIVVFDPETVAEQATVRRPDAAPLGIGDVIVSGWHVVKDCEVVPGVFPGKQLRGRPGTQETGSRGEGGGVS